MHAYLLATSRVFSVKPLEFHASSYFMVAVLDWGCKTEKTHLFIIITVLL